MVLMVVTSMKWDITFEEKGVSSIIFFSLDWFCTLSQDCFWTEAVVLLSGL